MWSKLETKDQIVNQIDHCCCKSFFLDHFTINYDARLNNRIDGLLEAKTETRMACSKTWKRIEDAEQAACKTSRNCQTN